LEQDFVDWKTALQTAITPCGFTGLQDCQGRLIKVIHKKHHYTKCLEESEQTFYAVGRMYWAYSLLQASNPYCDGFLPCDASAERGYEIACHPSVRLPVTIGYRVQIGLISSKIISWPNSLRPMRSLTPDIGDLVQREHPQNWG